MVNKKGLLRIVEASIAVLIVLAVILLVSVNKERDIERDLSEILTPILDEIARNTSLRDKIFLDEINAIEEMETIVSNQLQNSFLSSKVVICGNINEFCGGLEDYPENAEGSIFSSERIISTRLDANLYNPKKLKIYLWKIRG